MNGHQASSPASSAERLAGNMFQEKKGFIPHISKTIYDRIIIFFLDVMCIECTHIKKNMHLLKTLTQSSILLRCVAIQFYKFQFLKNLRQKKGLIIIPDLDPPKTMKICQVVVLGHLFKISCSLLRSFITGQLCRAPRR